MNVIPVQLKELLARQRSKMDPQHPKAQYIDWLLAEEEGSVKVNGKNRKTRATELQPKGENRVVAPRKKSTRIRPNKPISATLQTEAARMQDSQRRQAEALKDPTLLTNVHFAERKDLHPNSKRALTQVMGLTTMTEIQARTFAAASSGRDVLGRARTGTGKTIAFLLPAIERVLQSGEYQVGRNVGILVISPTRELATQIAQVAESLVTFHHDLSVQVVYGGTKLGRDVNQLKKALPTILVATPGRLKDHLESTVINGRKFGADIMASTPVLVLDETDRLLDMGFRREIAQILTFLPRSQKRQTLLFSATIPPELKQIMAETMKPDFIEVDCINDGDGATHTNARVQQSHVIIPSMDRYVSSVVEIVCLAMKDGGKDGKIVVFFPTAKMVSFFAALFSDGLDIPVMELHSKKSQGHRNKASAQFRSASSAVLFTSDVSARGMFSLFDLL
jgi:ATP-dependent RNA helicase MSS116